MKLRTDIYDLWVFHRCNKIPEYLLYNTSQQKADKWFFGSRFWQIPGGFAPDEKDPVDAMQDHLSEKGLSVMKIWAAEYTYTYYNARRRNIEIVPVFAAEVEKPEAVELTWEHSEYGWFNAEQCFQRLKFRGLIEGLKSTCRYVSESEEDNNILRLL